MIRVAIVCAAVLLVGCGSSGQDGAGGGQETGGKFDVPSEEGSSSGGVVTADSSTGMSDGCSEVVDGPLEITDASDFEWLKTVREVQGDVMILGLQEAEDLSFLSCLESIEGGLIVRETRRLRSLEGLERLRTLEGDDPEMRIGGVSVTDNEALVTLKGLDSLDAIRALTIRSNPSLVRLELNHVERMNDFVLGILDCPDGVPIAVADNPSLKAIDGLDALNDGTRFAILGQSGLESIDALIELAARRQKIVPPPEIPTGEHNNPVTGKFNLNPLLPIEQIDAFHAVSGYVYTPSTVCGNKDDENVCECPGAD